MSLIAWLLPFVMIAVYGTVICATVIFVQSVVRISYSFVRMTTALEEIAFALRAKPPL